MDYSQLSDFEINKLVARALDGLHGDDRTAVDCYLSTFNSNAVSVDDGDIGWIICDYCNKANDAWPIIIENWISVCAYKRENHGMKEVTWWEADRFCEHITRDENPLRAAMIVFLRMKEQSHE